MNIRKNYHEWGILFNYGISIISIFFAIMFHQHWIVLIPILFYLIHDIDFVRDKNGKNFEGRTYKGTVESIRAASNYISYFIALIGVFISILVSSNDWESIKNIIDNKWIKAYGFILIVLSGISLLFIPIRYKEEGKNNRPTRALKNCFFVVLFFEKVIIIFLLYILIYIVNEKI